MPPLVSLKYLWRVHVGENKGDTGEQVAEREREREETRTGGKKKKKKKKQDERRREENYPIARLEIGI